MSKLRENEPQRNLEEVQIEIEHENPGNSRGIRVPNTLPMPPEHTIDHKDSIYDNFELYKR